MGNRFLYLLKPYLIKELALVGIKKLPNPLEGFTSTLMKLIDKVAGKESDLKLTFHDLTLEMGTMKAHLDGSAVFDLSFATKRRVGVDMELPSWLGNVFKLGEIALAINDQKTLQLKAENRKINMDIIDKQFIKKVLGGLGEGKASFRSSLSQLRNIAEELRNEALTVTISYRSSRVITMGLDAKPKFSKIVSGTNAIEINSLFKLIELAFSVL